MTKRYADYLQSDAWRELRKAALARDEQKCRACDAPARHVHHARYPKRLGEEPLEWLYSLCAGCHEAIHLLGGASLQDATAAILARRPGSNVIRLADDWRLSTAASRKRQFAQARRRRRGKSGAQAINASGRARKGKVSKRLVKQNDEIRAQLKRNKERRALQQAMQPRTMAPSSASAARPHLSVKSGQQS